MEQESTESAVEAGSIPTLGVMDELQRAIQDVRAFLLPPEGFVSGDRIYDPELDDRLELLKREIVEFGRLCSDACDQDARLDLEALNGLRRRLDEFRSRLAPENLDPESPVYARFMDAIERLLSVAATCRKPSH